MPTVHCQWCDQNIYIHRSVVDIFLSDDPLCADCRSLLKPVYQHFKIDDVDGLTIYNYDQTIQDMLYQYKTMYDITLATAFSPPCLYKLKHYCGRRPFLMAPSALSTMKDRGFHTLDHMVKPLHPTILHPFYRLDDTQQKQKTANQRHAIQIMVKPNITLDDHVILFDDVYITGSTINACIHALKDYGIKDIKVLVLAKER